MMTSTHQHRKKYGRTRLTDTRYDGLFSMLMTSVKKQPQFWAQHIKPTMTFDTFKTRLRDYLRRTNQVLPATQLERMRLPDAVIKRYALLYLDVCATVINKAQFFEEYIIVPPYNEVPSYEHLLRKVNPMITKLVEENRSICSEQQVCMIFSSIVDLHDPGNHIAFFKQQEESELDNNCSEQPVMMEVTYTDSEATSELDNKVHEVLCLGCAEPAGDGMGYGFDLKVYKVFKKQRSFRTVYISSDLWIKWKPYEYKQHMQRYDVVLIWASLQDVNGDLAVSSEAHIQW